MPSNITPDLAFHRTYSASFIRFPGDDAPPFIHIPPRPPDPRRQPLSPAERSDVYAALLHGAEYLERAQDAFLDGDDGAVRYALAVLAAIVKVVASQLHTPSNEYLVLQ